jgi:hypothetical protein
MATPIPLTAGFIVVDTTSVKTFQLPLSTDIVGRSITLKDRTGNAGTNNITIQTQGGDTFQGGSTSYKITQPYGSATFVSRNGQWVLQQGSELIYASSILTNYLGVSTISAVNQISAPNLLTSTVTFIDTINAQKQILAVSSGTLVLNGQAITGGGVTQLVAGSNISLTPPGGVGVVTVNNTINPTGLVSTANLSGLVSTPNLLNLVSTQNLSGLVSTPNLLNLVSTPFLNTSLVSTTIGLQTYISSFIDPVELASTVTNLISTTFFQNALTSSVAGLGTAGYVSTAALRGFVSTPNLLNLVSTANLSNLISTANLIGLVSTPNLLNLVSTGNLLNLVSTPFLNTSLVSTTIGLQTYISSFVDPVELASTVANLISTTAFQNALTSTVANLGRIYVSTPSLVSTVAGLGTAGYVSTSQLVSTSFGITSNYSTFFSTTLSGYTFPYSGAELYLNYSLSVPPYQQLGISNIIGPSYSNVFPVPLNSSNNFVTGFQSDFFLPSFLQSGLWTTTLFAQADAAGASVYASLFDRTPGGVESVIATSSNSPFIVPLTKVPLDLTVDVPYYNISTGNTLVLKIFANNTTNQPRALITYYENGNYSHVATTLSQVVATSYITSTIAGLGTLGYVSTSQLVSTVAGLGTAGYVSTASLLGLVSTPNLQNLVSTSFLETQLVSSVRNWSIYPAISTIVLSTQSARIINSNIAGVITVETSNVIFSDLSGNPAKINAGIVGFDYVSPAKPFYLNQVVYYAKAPRALGLYDMNTVNTGSLYLSSIYFGDISGTIQGQLTTDAAATNLYWNDVPFVNQTNLFSTTSNWSIYPAISSINMTGLNPTIINGSDANNVPLMLQTKFMILGDSNYAPGILYHGTSVFATSTNTSQFIFANDSFITGNVSSLGLGYSDAVGNNKTGSLYLSSIYLGGIGGSIYGQITTNESATDLFWNGSTLVGGGTGGGDVTTASLVSTVAGLGEAGYVSTANLLNLVSTSYFASQLTSTVRGLGTLGYISSLSTIQLSTGSLLTRNVLLTDINTNNQNTLTVSSGILLLNGQGVGSGGGGGGGGGLTASEFVVGGRLAADQNLTADVDNTIQFIDDFDPQNWYNASTYFFTPTIGGYYLVSYQVWFNAGATTNNQWNIQIQKNSADSYTITQNVQNTNSGQSLNATKIIYMNGSTDNLRFRAYVGSTSNTTAKALQGNNTGTGTFFTATLLTNGSSGDPLFSTVAGLGNAGYISSSQLLSTTAGLVLPVNLASTVAGLGTAGYVSTSRLAGLVSTANLLNLVSTANLSGLVSTPNLINLVSTANLTGLVSTPNLANHVSTANLIGLVSTPNLLNLVSTAFLNTSLASTTLGLQTYISSFIDPVELASTVANLISTTALQNALASTVTGLGTAGFVSSASLLGLVSTPNLLNHVSTANLLGLVSTPNLVNLVSTANLLGLVSTPNLLNLVSTPFLNTSLVSTTVGLQTYISSFIDPVELASTVANLISTTALQNALASTVANLGQAGYVSTSMLAGHVSTPNLLNLVSTANLSGLISSPNLLNLVSTANLLGLVSTPNLLNLVSTPFLNTSLVSTTLGLQTYISSFIDPVELASTVANLISTTALQNALASTVTGLGTAGYVSSASLLGLVSTPNLLNHVSTANLIGLVSTANLLGLVSTPNLQNLVSTQNLIGLVSTPNLLNLVSTPFLNTSLVSTTLGLQTYISSFIDPVELASTVANLISTTALQNALASTVANLGTAGYVSTANLIGLVSSANLANLVSTTNLLGLVSTPNLLNIVSTAFLDTSLTSTSLGLQTYISSFIDPVELASTVANLISTTFLQNALASTVANLGTAGYVSTANLIGLVSTANLANIVSTPNLLNLVSTPNLANLISTANLVNLVSTQNLLNLVSTQNLANLVSTPNLLSLVSTPNLLNLVSTTYLTTQLVSTIIGLSNVAVTQIIAGSNVSISPAGGLGAVTINGNAAGLLTIPANLSTSAFFTSSIEASTTRSRIVSTGLTTASTVLLYDPLSGNTGNNFTVASTFFYFNNFIIGGTRVAQPQWVVF